MDTQDQIDQKLDHAENLDDAQEVLATLEKSAERDGLEEIQFRAAQMVVATGGTVSLMDAAERVIKGDAGLYAEYRKAMRARAMIRPEAPEVEKAGEEELGPATQELNRLARKLVEERKPEWLAFGDALLFVATQRPDLYQRYIEESRRQLPGYAGLPITGAGR